MCFRPPSLLPLRSCLLCPSSECGEPIRISSYSDAATIILVGVDGRISPTLGSALHSPTPTRVFVVSIDGTEGHQPSSALVVLRLCRHDNSGGIGGGVRRLRRWRSRAGDGGGRVNIVSSSEETTPIICLLTQRRGSAADKKPNISKEMLTLES